MERNRQIELFLRWRDSQDRQAQAELWDAVLDSIKRARGPMAAILREYDAQRLDELLDEIANRTYIEVEKKLDQFDPYKSAKFTTFCVGFAKYVAQRMRTEARSGSVPLDGIGPDLESSPSVLSDPASETPHQEVISEEYLRLLAEAISQLPDGPTAPLRTVFCLRQGYQPGPMKKGLLIPGPTMTEHEIARKYGCSRSWVSKKYTQAKGILAKKLSREFYESNSGVAGQGE